MEELIGGQEKSWLLLNGCLLMLTWIMCLFINRERKGFYRPFVVRYTLAALWSSPGAAEWLGHFWEEQYSPQSAHLDEAITEEKGPTRGGDSEGGEQLPHPLFFHRCGMASRCAGGNQTPFLIPGERNGSGCASKNPVLRGKYLCTINKKD